MTSNLISIVQDSFYNSFLRTYFGMLDLPLAISDRKNQRYFLSFGAASGTGYVLAGATTYELLQEGIDPLTNAIATASVKAAAHLAIMPLAYTHITRGHISQNSNKDNTSNLTRSTFAGVLANNSLKAGLHYWLLSDGRLSPVLSFLVAYILPGAIGTGVRFAMDHRKGYFGMPHSSGK